MTHDVWKVVHILSSFVRSWSAVIVIHRLQSSFCRVVRGASGERNPSFRKLRLSIDTAHRVGLVVH